MDSSVPSAIPEELDRQAAKIGRADKINQWLTDRLNAQYHKCKQLQKILRALKAKHVGNNAQASMSILYGIEDKMVYRGNASMTVSDALGTWDGEDFAFGDTSSDATAGHTSDASTSDEPLAALTGAEHDINEFQKSHPNFFDETPADAPAGGSSDTKVSELEQPVVEDPWTDMKPARSKAVGRWNDAGLKGISRSFDSDDDVPPKKQCVSRETVFGSSSLFGAASVSVNSTPQQCFSASASNRAYERSQAKQQRNKLKEQDEQIENDRRKNLSGEERKQEDAQTMFESERLFDMQEAERKSKIPHFVSSSDAYWLGANAALDYDDPPSASASSGDRDKSLADTMRISPEIVEIFDSD